MLLSLALISAAVFACASSQPQQPTQAPDPCNFEGQASEIWNPKVKTDLALPLKILHGTFEAQEAEMLTTKLDLFTDDWISMRGSVCRDHLAGSTMSDDEYQARVDCFDAILNIQQTIISLVEEEDRAVLEQIAYLSNAIEPCIASDQQNSAATRLNPFNE